MATAIRHSPFILRLEQEYEIQIGGEAISWYGDGWEGNGAQKREILHFSSSPFTLILDRTLFVGKIASP